MDEIRSRAKLLYDGTDFYDGPGIPLPYVRVHAHAGVREKKKKEENGFPGG